MPSIAHSELVLILFPPQPPNHNITNPSLKGPHRSSHHRARVAASPYPRDSESVHSSSSETEDMSLFLANPTPDYNPMYNHHATHHQMHPSQDALHATGAFGRMNINTSDPHGLEKLAAAVRAATTTSASDRAKQIFVQAWSVPYHSIVLQQADLSSLVLGSLPTMPPTLMGMFHDRACTSLIEGFVINMESLT